LALAGLVVGAQQAHATNESSYRAGYKHGVDDAKTPWQNATGDWLYIIKPGKGFAFHTKEFNQGYIDGYCSLESTGGMPGMDADQATFNCPDDSPLYNLRVQHNSSSNQSEPTPANALYPNSYHAGYDYGTNDWNQHTDNKNYSCSLTVILAL